MSTPAADNLPISPAAIASKLARLRNFENERVMSEINADPRLVELLWFIQYMSVPENNPGGLRKFAADLVADSKDLIGTFAMTKHSENALSETKLLTVHREIPSGEKWPVFHGVKFWNARRFEFETKREYQARRKEFFHDRTELLGKIQRSDLVEECGREAGRDLASYLRRLCEHLDTGFYLDEEEIELPDETESDDRPADERDGLETFGSEAVSDYLRSNWKKEHASQAPWYFVRAAEAALRFMDRRKAEISARIASTEVSRLVFHWLHKARATRCGIAIEGNSRFGKTEAVKAWAEMHPGLSRYVYTPPSRSEGDLLRAIATALGLQDFQKLRPHVLRNAISQVLSASGIMLIFDEAQSLFPLAFTRNTPPARLNYVRSNVLDAGLPAAFISTPQSYRHAQQRFLKATGFAIEQWSERILKTVALPAEVEREDLMGIARIHFPGLSEAHLEMVVDRTHGTERNYVSDISKIARLAYSNAEDDGLSAPKVSHLKAAMADVLPSLPQDGAAGVACSLPVGALPARCNTPASRVQPRRPTPQAPILDRSKLADAELVLPG